MGIQKQEMDKHPRVFVMALSAGLMALSLSAGQHFVIKPFKFGEQIALFKDPVRTAR